MHTHAITGQDGKVMVPHLLKSPPVLERNETGGFMAGQREPGACSGPTGCTVEGDGWSGGPKTVKGVHQRPLLTQEESSCSGHL